MKELRKDSKGHYTLDKLPIPKSAGDYIQSLEAELAEANSQKNKYITAFGKSEKQVKELQDKLYLKNSELQEAKKEIEELKGIKDFINQYGDILDYMRIDPSPVWPMLNEPIHLLSERQYKKLIV